MFSGVVGLAYDYVIRKHGFDSTNAELFVLDPDLGIEMDMLAASLGIPLDKLLSMEKEDFNDDDIEIVYHVLDTAVMVFDENRKEEVKEYLRSIGHPTYDSKHGHKELPVWVKVGSFVFWIAIIIVLIKSCS